MSMLLDTDTPARRCRESLARDETRWVVHADSQALSEPGVTVRASCQLLDHPYKYACSYVQGFLARTEHMAS
jgi:hypothetical protein